MKIDAKKIQDRGLKSFTWLVALLGMRKAIELVQDATAGKSIAKYLPYGVTLFGIFGQAASSNKWIQELATAATVVGAEASIRSAITDDSGIVKQGQLPQMVAKALPASSGLGSFPSMGSIRVMSETPEPAMMGEGSGVGSIRLV